MIYLRNMYVENVREELDEAGEWFYDEDEGKLYLWPNQTAAQAHAQSQTNAAGLEVVVPLLDSIITVSASFGSAQSAPPPASLASEGGKRGGDVRFASDIRLTGFEFTETRATFLEQYEVPSGGDWTIQYVFT